MANGGKFLPPFALEELPDRLKIPIENYAVGGSAELTQEYPPDTIDFSICAAWLQVIFRIIGKTPRSVSN